MNLRPTYIQSLGEEGDTGSVGRTIHWRSRYTQTHMPITHAFQAVSTGPRLDAQAYEGTSRSGADGFHGVLTEPHPTPLPEGRAPVKLGALCPRSGRGRERRGG